MRLTVVILTSLLACSATQGGASEHGECYGRLRNPLTRGGYSGELDCRRISISIEELGRIGQGDHYLEVFGLVYRTIGDGVAPHAGQRIILVRDGTEYVGQYSVPTPPVHRLRLSVGSVFVDDVPTDHGNRVDLSDGIPKEAHLDGEVVRFYK